MAADGSRGPRPYTKRTVSTVFLRVPAGDWPAVKRGYKTEFRAGSGRNAVPQLWHLRPPCAAIAYSVRNGRHDAAMMLLEALWQEPLGAISPESLEREGFATLAEFRTYWMGREHKRFTPTRQIFAYRVRPWRGEDGPAAAGALFEHLYGEFLAAA